MSTELTNVNWSPDPEWVREQVQNQSDTVVGIMLIRLRQLQNARVCGDEEVEGRAGMALVGMFLLAGQSHGDAYQRVLGVLAWIDKTEPELLVPGFWRKDLTMFQLMDSLRRDLGRRHLRGVQAGVRATRLRLLGALLACGLSLDDATKRLQVLEKNAIEARWSEGAVLHR